MRRSIRGLYAPSQIPTGCAGAGPACSPTARWKRPSTRTVPSPAQTAADDRDRLLEGLHRLAGRQAGPAGGHDRVPERPGTETELDAPSGEEVEGGDRLGEDDRLAQGQVRDVERHPQGRGPGREHREQRPGVEVPRLVRVVLDRHEVEPAHLGDVGELDDPVGAGRVGRGEEPELEVVPVVGHAPRPSRSPSSSRGRRPDTAYPPSSSAIARCGFASSWRPSRWRVRPRTRFA